MKVAFVVLWCLTLTAASVFADETAPREATPSPSATVQEPAGLAAQGTPGPVAGPASRTDQPKGGNGADTLSKHDQMMVALVLCGTIVAFGLIIVGLQTLIILRSGTGWTETATKTFGLTLVVVAGVYLCSAGFTTEQITPMISLLGTVAGFLLGRNLQPESEAAPRKPGQTAQPSSNQPQS